MRSSCEVRIENEDVERCRNTHGDDKGREHHDIKRLFRMLENEEWDNDHESNLQEIRHTLKRNKKLLTCRFKMKSIIHTAKYKSKMNYDHKQDVINTIIDVGYTSFQFATDSSTRDNFHALFFVAAKGDYEELKEIVTYFRDCDVTKIHDTLEGDTVLSFMVKFGNHFQVGFLDCFKFMLHENIAIERVDYYSKNVNEVIDMEIDFLNTRNVGDTTGRINKLNDIKKIINQFPKSIHDPSSGITIKYELFQALIKKDKKFTNLLKRELANLDDGENTLLQLAIIKNNLKTAKELLSKKANPNSIVQGGNEEAPLVLAAKLGRAEIFREILKNKNVKITNAIFAIFVREMKPKFLNFLLESEVLDVNVTYNDKIPLFYAIARKNRAAVQSLLRRGSRVNEIHLQNINPKDLEDYFNSCIKQDSFAEDMEENQYKPLLVFDFFINSSGQPMTEIENFKESQPLIHNKDVFTEQFNTEVAVIRTLGSNKRLKHLLDHPLIYIYMILKWNCVEVYYKCFLLFKFIFYIIIDILLYTNFFKFYMAAPIIIIQGAVVFYNYRQFKCEFRKYTLHYLLEISILVCLEIICILAFMDFFNIGGSTKNMIIQISAVVIIFTSLSMLLTIGYHFSLSKWMAMAKRVFKNFTVLLLFFMIPIIAFATSFNLLNSLNVESAGSENNSTDFDSFPRALFRTLVMLGGDIGDKKFSAVGGYIVFIFFTIAMAIILLNFWTGVAVSDIKEIEEQSTIVAFKNVIVFIESVERMYHFFDGKIFQGRCFPQKCREMIQRKLPFLKPKIYLKGNEHFHYGIHFYINCQKQFNNKYFNNCRIPNCIILKIKSLFEEKEVNMGKILKELISKVESIHDINIKLTEIQQLLQSQNKSKKK